MMMIAASALASVGARMVGAYIVEKMHAALAANREIVDFGVNKEERVEGKNIITITTVYGFNAAGNVVATFSNREVRKKPGIFGGKKKKGDEDDLAFLKDL